MKAQTAFLLWLALTPVPPPPAAAQDAPEAAPAPDRREAADVRFRFRCLRLLATREESREMKRIGRDATGEQAAYTEEFWNRRRYSFSIPLKEARRIFEERCREAERLFGGGDDGVFSERGKIWVRWGPPDDRLTSVPPPTIYTYTGGHLVVEAERWIYYAPPDKRLPQYYTIEFVRLRGSPRFEPAVRVSQMLGLTSFPASLELRAAADYGLFTHAAGIPLPKFAPLLEHFDGAGPAEDFPFAWHAFFVRAEKPEISALILTFRAKAEDLGGGESAEPPIVGARITSRPAPDGELSGNGEPPRRTDLYAGMRPFAKNAEITPYHYYQATIPLRPGGYRLQIGAYLPGSKRVSVQEAVLEVPSFASDFPRLTEPLLARGKIQKISSKDAEALGPGPGARPLLIGNSHFVVPRMDSVYTANDLLSVYCQVYNPEREGDARNAPYDVIVVRHFSPSSDEEYREVDRVEQALGATGDVWGLEAPLKDYPGGFYRFDIIVRDSARPERQHQRGFEFILRNP